MRQGIDRKMDSLGFGVLCREINFTRIRAGAVAAFQMLSLIFRGAKKLASWISRLPGVRRGVELQTGGNAKLWPQPLATHSTISVIANITAAIIASLLRSAISSRLCRLGRCSRIRRHERF